MQTPFQFIQVFTFIWNLFFACNIPYLFSPGWAQTMLNT